jgi:hypothetical protein
MKIKFATRTLVFPDHDVHYTNETGGGEFIAYRASTHQVLHRNGSVAFRTEDLGVFFDDGSCAFCEDSAAVLDPAGRKLLRLPDNDEDEMCIAYSKDGLELPILVPHITIELGSGLQFQIGPRTLRICLGDIELVGTAPGG